ncbi:outer membrane assembly lipoprotein YfiO [Melioribacter roseus P3M-2]|uniref:Outer membrane assembly lipoprotein YfiO n=1 Tax=Melioribacter roseus (strain DSM 23840 / JCM 17771 / VKM B-2668 / P3M-2) TaxID=1191523 RepID=I6ZS16_MELRP|nr:outer membrane protein assembly factor BamD [Melioribacter roseus]AFN74854.1 outer membrane assembly lipoprotein YfiO [Melioribacter roseus P3M-2]
MPYKRLFAIALIVTACSGMVDTSKFNAEEYFSYAMKLYEDGDYEQAVLEFNSILLQFPGSTVSDDAQYYLAMTYYKREQFLLAAYEFSKLIQNYATSPHVPDAQFMLADSYYNLSPPFQLDQSYTKKAIEEFQAFIDIFPANPKVEEAERKIVELNDKLARKEYESGIIYEKMEYEKAAMKYYDFVVDTYHDTRFAPMALYRKIQIEIRRGMTNEALNDIAVFLTRYPNDERADEIEKLQAELNGLTAKAN